MSNVGCNISLTHTIHFGKCVPIIKMHWNEHGRRTCGCTWVQQGKLENACTPYAQQFHGEPNKAASQKTKRAKLEQGACTSYFTKQGGKDKFWKCVGPHQKKDCPQSSWSHYHQP